MHFRFVFEEKCKNENTRESNPCPERGLCLSDDVEGAMKATRQKETALFVIVIFKAKIGEDQTQAVRAERARVRCEEMLATNVVCGVRAIDSHTFAVRFATQTANARARRSARGVKQNCEQKLYLSSRTQCYVQAIVMSVTD